MILDGEMMVWDTKQQKILFVGYDIFTTAI